MPAGWVAGGVAAAGVIGSVISSNAAKSAAQTQADAANNATAAQSAALDKQLALQQPYVNAGTTAVNQLSAMTQPGGAATQNFSYAPFDYNQNTDPGTQFRLKQGLDAMNATAAARGGLISGNALKAGQDYGQAQGSQEYANAFNRYLTNYSNAQNTFQLNRNNLLDPLKFLTNTGQAGASNQAANVGSFGSSQAANTIGAGNANAAGQIGSANAYTGGASNAINQYMMYNALNKSAYSPSGSVGSSSNPITIDPNTGGTNQPVDYSDIRMKENIKQIDILPSGLNVYSFEYKPEFKDLAGHGVFIGVMAQEAEKVIPDSVVTMKNGYKAVKYNLIH